MGDLAVLSNLIREIALIEFPCFGIKLDEAQYRSFALLNYLFCEKTDLYIIHTDQAIMCRLFTEEELFSPVCTYHLSVCKKQQPSLQTIHRDDEDEQDDKDEENNIKY